MVEPEGISNALVLKPIDPSLLDFDDSQTW